MLISDPQFLRDCTDEALYNEICDKFEEFSDIQTTARAFDDAIVQIEAKFVASQVEDA